METSPLSEGQIRLIRQWAKAYRAWNEQQRAQRQRARRRSIEEKLALFFELWEAVAEIAPPKSAALHQAQLQAHLLERQRMQRFEELRAHGKSIA